MPDYPRIMIAAPKSGSGKTVMTCALLRLLSRRGTSCRAFKSGPDYLDPMFHRTVLGIPSRNLDLFLAGTEGVRDSFIRQADPDGISVVEGAMGYFDGLGGLSMTASAWDLARSLGLPVLLTVDCSGMSRSAVAMVKGFIGYEEVSQIRGILLNRVSPHLAGELKKCIQEETGIPVIGTLPKIPDWPVMSRHLGLVQPDEIPGLLKSMDRAADLLSETLDYASLLRIAESAGPFPGPLAEELSAGKETGVRIGVAKDEAFSFYYPENLELLERLGAELVFFSPMHDTGIPEVSGLLFGGGYPELHAETLSANLRMLQEVKAAAESGMPILGECGGFLYLCQFILDPEGKRFPMAGVLPGEGYMQGKPVRFGYCTLAPKEGGSGYLHEGHLIRAHEFHYYESTEPGNRCRAVKPVGSWEWECMQIRENVMAGVPHLYYPSDPEFARSFVRQCREFGRASCGS